MLTAWSNFAKFGDPNGAAGAAPLGVDGSTWQPYTAATPQFMVWKLDDAEAEASAMGEPLVAPRPAFGARP
jgi:para-nitrobenzyl esterase